MVKTRLFVVLLIALAIAAGHGGAASAGSRNFVAHLTGSQEVPARDTAAQGQATFHLSKDGTELRYQLIVANIENVVAAHIHLGSAGSNGPVVAFLYGSVPPGGGSVDGVLAEGTITGAKLVGPLAGHPFSDLIDAIKAGNAYVNVHTNDGVAPVSAATEHVLKTAVGRWPLISGIIRHLCLLLLTLQGAKSILSALRSGASLHR